VDTYLVTNTYDVYQPGAIVSVNNVRE